jgi:hypothetical protein
MNVIIKLEWYAQGKDMCCLDFPHFVDLNGLGGKLDYA